MRYTKRQGYSDEQPANSNTDYSANLDQSSMLLLARVPVIKAGSLRVDVFAGFGGSNTILTVKSATQDGELSRKSSAGWFASPYTAYGASVAVGYKQVYLFIEGGLETNKVDGFKRTGTVSSSLDNITLSGSYFAIGLMFDGVPGSIR
jgi:hypothetical protein